MLSRVEAWWVGLSAHALRQAQRDRPARTWVFFGGIHSIKARCHAEPSRSMVGRPLRFAMNASQPLARALRQAQGDRPARTWAF